MSRRMAALSASALLVAGLSLSTSTVATSVQDTAEDAPAGGALPEWPEPGSARVVPLHETGPASERLNLVILCDGYQYGEIDKCRDDVDRNQAVQWSVEPFRTYRHYINVYLVEIVSYDSGVRRDPEEDAPPEERDATNTPLRLWYADGLTNPLARGITYGEPLEGASDGSDCPGHPTPTTNPDYPLEPGILGDPACNGDQQRAMYLNSYVADELGLPQGSFDPTRGPGSGPQNVQTLAISNTFTYGGIGGRDATTSGGSPQAPLISLHELGHSLGEMQDEYPYWARDVPGDPYPDSEPGSFHHTRMTAEEMIEAEAKWFRWLGEESESGGTIRAADPDGYESGLYSGSNVWRPSQSSMMRWIGFYFDQVGREHMVARITGQRDRGEMSLEHTPEGEVRRDSVLWVEPMQPRYHEMQVTWRVGGPDGDVLDTGNSRYLDLSEVDVQPGTSIHVEVRDPVGPDGIDWVRNPSTGNSATDSGYNGPRFVQTREWTVGRQRVMPDRGPVEFTGWTPDEQPVAGDEVVYVRTQNPRDRVLEVTWLLDGEELATEPHSRTLNLDDLDLDEGTYDLTAVLSDPGTDDAEADDAEVDSVTWVVDNELPSAPRTLSESLTTLDGDVEHPVYFGGWDMWLDPQDERAGYDDDPYVVGEFRLNDGGWFNYFGFPEEPMPESPFRFRHSGIDVKALTYGNLGTGGLSKAAFEQEYGPDDPNGPFVPGYGTHVVEHRAIDPAGNIGAADEYRATVLPGGMPECTQTVSGSHDGPLMITDGVVCVEDAQVDGGVTVRGGSLVVSDSSIDGTLIVDDAADVQVFGSTLRGRVRVSGTQGSVTVAGSTFHGAVTLSGNEQVPHDESAERFSEYGYEYGPILAGNTFYGRLSCTGNDAPARDFDAANRIDGPARGDCADL
ncbi:peptidase M64 [Actinobacteria bacterium YIM 96077]|uniref:Peptidase M64 n=1 Tax=Phytoactinopolyspora halophila TaxID=1981511 RepID=A0A329QGT6_9ACTN|nr:M64 family metallopeptidase [Phytoactinopolyspora halophila]AYY14715.1 peptidase M64 [Actinobacteria bacterium YIM 96077]RAW11574.1 peptidase M64 [Phytoactinopolyspora halophila]